MRVIFFMVLWDFFWGQLRVVNCTSLLNKCIKATFFHTAFISEVVGFFASNSRLCWWYQTFLPMIVRMMIHSKTIHLESQTAALLNGLAPESRNKLEGNSALSASVITARLRGILLYKAAAATDFPMKFWLVFSSPLTWHLDWFLPKGRRHFTKLNFSMD